MGVEATKYIVPGPGIGERRSTFPLTFWVDKEVMLLQKQSSVEVRGPRESPARTTTAAERDRVQVSFDYFSTETFRSIR